jgi:alpha-glucosidase (family GH31 glycosyl hydrolase)
MDANNQSSPFIGRVRPGYVTFVDFFHPNATQYWIDMLAQFN